MKSAFQKWTHKLAYENKLKYIINIHKKKENELKNFNKDNYKIEIFDGKVLIFKIRKIKTLI